VTKHVCVLFNSGTLKSSKKKNSMNLKEKNGCVKIVSEASVPVGNKMQAGLS
jgi:hypothetical protein